MSTTTETTPLTRRQAREIERRTGVRPIAGHDGGIFDTGEIARNEITALVSVLPASVIERMAEEPALSAAPAAFDARSLTVRASRPAALIAARRRRTIGGFAAAASAAALATTGIASLGAQVDVADAHEANLVTAANAAGTSADDSAAAIDTTAPEVAAQPAAPIVVDESNSSVVALGADVVQSAAAEAPAPVVPAPSSTSSSAPSATAASSSWSGSVSGGSVMSIAENLTGVPYVFGGTTPSGFDCAGYVSYVLRQAGYSNATTSISQLASMGTVTSNPVPGDLVVYGTYHIGFYSGPNDLLHAPTEGDVVRHGNMNWDSHYFVHLG